MPFSCYSTIIWWLWHCLLDIFLICGTRVTFSKTSNHEGESHRLYNVAWCRSLNCNHQHNWAATWQNQQGDCAPSEDSDQPGHPPSLIRDFAVRTVGSKGPKLSSFGQRRLWSDCADAQADLSLRWAHTHFVGFVVSRLISRPSIQRATLTCLYRVSKKNKKKKRGPF